MKIGLVIGLNAVDPSAYKGWPGELTNPVNDARAYASLYAQHGFTMNSLLNERAFGDAVRDGIKTMADETGAGDSVVIAYGGHGARYGGLLTPYNETILLWDEQMTDSEFHSLLCRFKPGVRVIVEFDSCHGGGMAVRGMGRSRAMPFALTKIIPEPEPRATRGVVEASVLFMAAARPDELASDGWGDNGDYTAARLRTRDEFKQPPKFREWFQATESYMLREHPQQHPVAVLLGPEGLWDSQIG